MQVKILEEATSDIRSIQNYLAEFPGVFEKLISKFNYYIKSIKNNPYMGKPGRKEGTREYFVSGTKYFIVYRIRNENLIEILTFLHTSRKY